MKQWIKRHYFLASLLGALALEAVIGPVYLLSLPRTGPLFPALWEAVRSLPAYGATLVMLAMLFFYPLVLTAIQLFLLLHRPTPALTTPGYVFDALTLGLGSVYTPVYLCFIRDTCFWADWNVTLSNTETHTPIATWHQPTVVVLALVGLMGYLLLTYVPLAKLPPLPIVLSMAGMYLACGEGILFVFQALDRPGHFWLGLLPLNLLLITARTIRYKIAQWNALKPEAKEFSSPLLRWCNSVLCKSKWWPLLAFVLMWPLLGVLICLLVLLGQSPSAAIRAWTETSDWNLSQKVAPQNVYQDEHYLCTVAAGGHRKLVRPLRMGVRHGHRVIVNRQLCVANAFEQILEEKTPRFHRVVRRFYDNYGFPVARLIHSPYLADVIYLLMKPLEWLFLVVLYCTDPRPEDRIAVQYTGKSVKDFA